MNVLIIFHATHPHLYIINEVDIVITIRAHYKRGNYDLFSPILMKLMDYIILKEFSTYKV